MKPISRLGSNVLNIQKINAIRIKFQVLNMTQNYEIDLIENTHLIF